MPNSVPISAETLKRGAMRIPATAAKTVEMTKLAVMAACTSIPMSRAASGFWTTASSALPRRVRVETSCSASPIRSPTTGMASWSG